MTQDSIVNVLTGDTPPANAPNTPTAEEPMAEEKESDGRERRRFIRMPAMTSAVAECGERYLNAFVHDISSNGLGISFVDELPGGPISHILLPKLSARIPCKTVWQSGSRYGLQFRERPYEVTGKLPLDLRQHLLPIAA